MTVFRSRTDAALVDPARARDTTLQEARTELLLAKATIARLERERDNAVSDRKAAVAVGKTWADDYSRLKRETAELACVNCEDQRENEYARGYCPRHAEKKRDEIDRLERELAEVRERLEFSRAGNATLTECGADTVRQLAEARRELAEANLREASAERVGEAWKRDAFHWMEEYGVKKAELADAQVTIERLTREIDEVRQREQRTIERLERRDDNGTTLADRNAALWVAHDERGAELREASATIARLERERDAAMQVAQVAIRRLS